MTGLKAILLMVGVAFAGLCIVAVVLTVAWLIGNYGVDRVLQVVSVMVSVAGCLFTVLIPFWRRR